MYYLLNLHSTTLKWELLLLLLFPLILSKLKYQAGKEVFQVLLALIVGFFIASSASLFSCLYSQHPKKKSQGMIFSQIPWEGRF